MFDVGFAELALLTVVGLLVLGPERLPRVARTIGGYLRKGRQAWNTVRREISSELDAEQIKEDFNQPVDEFNELRRVTRDAARQAAEETEQSLKTAADDVNQVVDEANKAQPSSSD